MLVLLLALHEYLFYSRVMGISCSIIKPKDVAKLHPFLNIHDLVGALHLPEDAVVSPSDVNHALAVAAAGRGIHCYSNYSLKGFSVITQ